MTDDRLSFSQAFLGNGCPKFHSANIFEQRSQITIVHNRPNKGPREKNQAAKGVVGIVILYDLSGSCQRKRRAAKDRARKETTDLIIYPVEIQMFQGV